MSDIQQIKIIAPHKKSKIFKAELREVLPYNLAELDAPVHFKSKRESSILLEISDSDKRFQILVLNDGQVDSVCIIIGHEREVFRQFIYVKSFLIIPFKSNRDKIDDNSSYIIHKI
jgi:hypothetical protein